MIISKEVNESVTLKFSQAAREMNEAGTKIISLGIGEPYFETPKEILDATIEALHKGLTKYSNPLGIFELRIALSEKLKKDNQIICPPEQIVVTPGAKQACILAMMALLEPNDEVINFTPCYVSYIPQIKLAEPQSVIHNIDVLKDSHRPDWNAMKAVMNEKTKLIIVNSPHNPTGYMFDQEDIDTLVQVLEEYPNCYLLSDEIYEKLNFSSIPHLSPGAVASISDRVITVNGFSKAYSMTGWRLGYLAAPKHLMSKLSKLQQHINTNTTTFIQKGAVAALKIDQTFIQQYNDELKIKVELLKEVVEKNSSKLKVVLPKGGIFAFLDVSQTGLDSDSFSLKYLQEFHVAATPGVAFGKDWNDHVRISLATNLEDFKEGMLRLGALVNKL